MLREAVLSDPYIHFDETYHSIIDKHAENGSRKGYFWAALSSRSSLIHLFTADGSRAKKVLIDYLHSAYSGAGYSYYKVIEGWDYPKAMRLGCIQHCKRKYIDIQIQQEAKDIIDTYNEFYHLRKISPKEKWIEQSWRYRANSIT